MAISKDLMKSIIWMVVDPPVERFLLRLHQSNEFPVAVVDSGTRHRSLLTTVAGVITLAHRAGFDPSRINIDDFIALLWCCYVNITGPTAMVETLQDLYDIIGAENSHILSKYITRVRDHFTNRGLNIVLDEGDADLVAVLRALREPYNAVFMEHLEAQTPGAAAPGGDGRLADPEDCKAVLRPMFKQLGRLLKKLRLFSDANIEILIQKPPRSLPALMALGLAGWTSAEKDALWAPMVAGLQRAKEHLQRMAAGRARSDTFQLDMDDVIGELMTQNVAESVSVAPAALPTRAAAVRGAGIAAAPAMGPQPLPTTHQVQVNQQQGDGGYGDLPYPNCRCRGDTRRARLGRKGWPEHDEEVMYYNCRDWVPMRGGGCGYFQWETARELVWRMTGHKPPNCYCRGSWPARVATSRTEKNPDRHFYGCMRFKCDFMVWVDEAFELPN